MNTIAGTLFGVIGNHKPQPTPQRDTDSAQQAATRYFEALARTVQPKHVEV